MRHPTRLRPLAYAATFIPAPRQLSSAPIRKRHEPREDIRKKPNALNAGNGGETHQIADEEHPVLTNHGTPISDNQNQLKASARGPVLIEDKVFREKINQFDHERIAVSRPAKAPARWTWALCDKPCSRRHCLTLMMANPSYDLGRT